MSNKTKLALLAAIFAVVGAGGILYLFFGQIAVMNPKGTIASQENDLLLFSTYLMLLIVIPVFIMTFGIAWKYLDENRKKYRPDWDYSLLAETVWWGFPFVLMAILGVVTWKACHQLDPFRPIASEKKAMTIQAVALQWKWLFLFPEEGIAAVNYFEIPLHVPIRFEITSDAPMNSFWIPQLSGQVYAMSGMRTELHAVASEPGSYRGSSANISGTGFAGMVFTAKAGSQEEFDAWVSSVRASPRALTYEEYEELVKPTSYVAPSFYSTAEAGLFDRIVMKYMGH